MEFLLPNEPEAAEMLLRGTKRKALTINDAGSKRARIHEEIVDDGTVLKISIYSLGLHLLQTLAYRIMKAQTRRAARTMATKLTAALLHL